MGFFPPIAQTRTSFSSNNLLLISVFLTHARNKTRRQHQTSVYTCSSCMINNTKNRDARFCLDSSAALLCSSFYSFRAWSGHNHISQLWLLTRWPGVGERESFIPAEPGTSKRGHFICRYCWREKRHNLTTKPDNMSNNTCAVYIKFTGPEISHMRAPFFFREKWKEWCETRRDLQLTPVQDPYCCWT